MTTHSLFLSCFSQGLAAAATFVALVAGLAAAWEPAGSHHGSGLAVAAGATFHSGRRVESWMNWIRPFKGGFWLNNGTSLLWYKQDTDWVIFLTFFMFPSCFVMWQIQLDPWLMFCFEMASEHQAEKHGACFFFLHVTRSSVHSCNNLYKTAPNIAMILHQFGGVPNCDHLSVSIMSYVMFTENSQPIYGPIYWSITTFRCRCCRLCGASWKGLHPLRLL